MLRHFFGTLSNTSHDTQNLPWLTAILQKTVVLSDGDILSTISGQRETVLFRQKLHPELSVLACASDSHRHALGNTLCWINPFLNHLSKVFLNEDLRGTLGQFKVQKVWLYVSRIYEKEEFCEQRTCNLVPQAILNNRDDHPKTVLYV